MGFLMKVAAADWDALRRFADITPIGQLGRGDVSYNEDLSTQLQTLHNLHKKGRITADSYNKYRAELIGAVDPQRVYDTYRREGAYHPDAQEAWDDYGEEAYTRTRQFYIDAVNRGLMSPEQAQVQLSKVQTGAPADPIYDWRKNMKPIQAPNKKTKPVTSEQGLVFSYRPGKWVDTRTGQPVTAPVPRKETARRVSAPVTPPAIPATPAPVPVDLSHMTPDTRRDIPGITRTAPAPTIDVLTTRSDKPVVAPAPVPTAPSAPVKAPRQSVRRQYTYADALNNGWSADADNAYGRGWVYRDNGDGTRTYRSPSQIKKLDPKAVRGGITVDAPKKVVAAQKPATPAPTA